MRFCNAIWASLLLLATPAFGEGSSGESCKHDGEHVGEHKCKHKRNFTFDYQWDVGFSDDKLGKPDVGESDKLIRKISHSYYAGIYFEKKWENFDLKLYQSLNTDDVADGLLIASINTELPRSYLSVEVGKGQLHFGGHRDHTSPYLSYHSPFAKYGVMGRIYAPVEGLGELSLMVANDVKHDDDTHGTGESRRWKVSKQALAPLFQYTGKFDMVSPILHFAFYDYEGGWYRSWAATAGVKLAIDKMALSIDGTWDNRKHHLHNEDSKDDEHQNTVYRNVVADLSYRHGMVTASLEASWFTTDKEDPVNRAPVAKPEGDKPDKPVMPEGYDDLKDDDPKKKKYIGDKKKYDDYVAGEIYDKGNWMKYENNMIRIRAGLDFHCIEDKFVPFVSWTMNRHEHVAEEWQDSHSLTIGIWGVI